MARFETFLVNDDGDEVPVKATGSYDESSLRPDSPPEGEVTLQELDAVLRNVGDTLKPGREFIIRRLGKKAFPGVISTPKGSEGNDMGTSFELQHKGYVRLKRRRCLPYTYNGNVQVRDSRTIRPWDFRRITAPGGALNTDGEPALAYGLPMEVIPQAIAGTRFAFIHDIRDATIFRPSGGTTPGLSTGDAQVYEDDFLGGRAGLQRVQTKRGTFKVGSPVVETVPLMNGDPAIRAMGVISSVDTLVLIGKRRGGEDPTVRVARNAGEGTRTWNSVTLTHVTTLDGVDLGALGLDAWELQTPFSFADAPTQKTQLGIEITLPGADTTTASSIYALATVCTTASDIGLTTGAIPAYSDPDSNHDLEVADFDLTGKNGQQAAEVWRRATTSDPATNPSPHWDLWVDADLALQVAERRGSDLDLTLSKEDRNVEVVTFEPYGKDLAFAVVGVTQGRGNGEIPVFDASELYDATRDPDGGALYGEMPQVLEYRPPGARTASAVRAAAKAFFKLHKDPQEFIEAKVIPEDVAFFATGDGVKFRESTLGLNASKRVVHVRRSWTPDDLEVLDVEFGERLTQPAAAFQSMAQAMQANDRLPAGNAVSQGASGAGVLCDKDHYGRLPFRVPEGATKVFLEIETIPFQASARASEAESTHTHGMDHTHTVPGSSHSHGMSHTHTVPGSSHTHTVPGSSHSHSVTGTTTSKDLVPGPQLQGLSNILTTFPSAGWTSIGSFTLPAATVATLDYAHIFMATWNDANSAKPFFYRIRVTQTSETDKYGAGGSGGASGKESSLGSTTDSVIMGYGIEAFDIGQLNLSKSATFYVEVQSATGATFDDETNGMWTFIPRHDHDVSGQTASATTPASVTSNATIPSSVTSGASSASTTDAAIPSSTTSGASSKTTTDAGSAHSHGLTHGVFQYAGDGLPTTDPPAYGEEVAWGVDVDTDSAGIPNNWAADKHPQTFGIRGQPHRFRIEVTDLVAQQGNGLPRPGVHFFYCLGAAYTGTPANSLGLAAVSVTADFEFREVQGA